MLANNNPLASGRGTYPVDGSVHQLRDDPLPNLALVEHGGRALDLAVAPLDLAVVQEVEAEMLHLLPLGMLESFGVALDNGGVFG